MRIEDLDPTDEPLLEALAVLSHAAAARHAPQWLPTLDAAREEVVDATAPERITRVAFGSDGEAVGWVSCRLGGVDLYRDPISALATLSASPDHAVNFWRRMGFAIVGVTPDAEGPGMPTIHLAKKVSSRRTP